MLITRIRALKGKQFSQPKLIKRKSSNGINGKESRVVAGLVFPPDFIDSRQSNSSIASGGSQLSLITRKFSNERNQHKFTTPSDSSIRDGSRAWTVARRAASSVPSLSPICPPTPPIALPSRYPYGRKCRRFYDRRYENVLPELRVQGGKEKGGFARARLPAACLTL